MAVAERMGVAVTTVRVTERHEVDSRMSTLVRYRDALLSLVDEIKLKEAELIAERMRLAEADPKNKWWVDQLTRMRTSDREWTDAKSGRYLKDPVKKAAATASETSSSSTGTAD